jgi:hypothetical protein
MQQAITRVSSAVGRGLAAGLVGTAAMTVSSSLEAKVRDRGSSDTPAEAVGTVLGTEGFEDEQAKARTNQIAHWAYGTSLGAVRGLLDAIGLGRNIADVAFHGIVWGAEQTMLPALGLAPPVTQWGAKEVVTDLTHHSVYSLTTNATYRWLSRR